MITNTKLKTKMKKTIWILLFCVAPLAGYAQFDEQFYQPAGEWRQNDLPPHQEMWITAGADSVHAVWCKPAEAEAKAAVLFCHGNYGNISYNDGIIRILVEAGFEVLAWDYPGFGRSNGKPTHTGIAAMGQRVFDEMAARDDVQGKKVIVYGFSIGCQIAARLARDNSARASALVLDAGMKSFTDMALLFSPEEAHPMIRRYVTSPYSAIEDVCLLEGMPKIIVHSPEDKVAPYSHSEEVFEVAAEPKVFFEYPGGHISALAAKKEEMLAAMARLIE